MTGIRRLLNAHRGWHTQDDARPVTVTLQFSDEVNHRLLHNFRRGNGGNGVGPAEAGWPAHTRVDNFPDRRPLRKVASYKGRCRKNGARFARFGDFEEGRQRIDVRDDIQVDFSAGKRTLNQQAQPVGWSGCHNRDVAQKLKRTDGLINLQAWDSVADDV